MGESIVVSDPQTMMCAHWKPPYCDEPAHVQDLCLRHYKGHWKKKDGPPTFVVRRVGHQIDVGSYDPTSGTGSCFVCGPRAVVYFVARGPGYLHCANYDKGLSRQKNTGWSPEEYDLALIAQAGLCALCGNRPDGRGKYGTLVADHCHASGRKRKLLCGWCNNALGLMQDSPTTLRAAAEYVLAPKGPGSGISGVSYTADPQVLLCAHWEVPYCDEPADSQDLCNRHYNLHYRRKGQHLAPTFAVRRVGHQIDVGSYDPASKTGSCFICGPTTAVSLTTRGYLACNHRNTGNTRQRKTGWSPEEYDLALIAQAGLCALCGNSPAGRGKYNTLTADHCHASGNQRKLLCGWCNTALGLMQDNPDVLRAAAEYVTVPSS